jgi:SseB protein N-terminal domain
MIADHLAELECADATAWVFVPSRPVAPNADRAWPELRRLTDGRLALLAYTSLRELVAACGQHQPWIAVPAKWLVRMQHECRFETVALNMDIPAELRHQSANVDEWPGKPEDWDA